MADAPIIIPHEGPRRDEVDDERGRFTTRLLVDASHGFEAGLVQGITEFAQGDEERPHTHPIAESGYILKGMGSVLLGEDRKEVAEGDTVLLPAHQRHGWRGGEGGMTVLFSFPAQRMDEVEYNFDAS